MKISGGKIDLQNSNSEIMKRRTFCSSNGKIKMKQKITAMKCHTSSNKHIIDDFRKKLFLLHKIQSKWKSNFLKYLPPMNTRDGREANNEFLEIQKSWKSSICFTSYRVINKYAYIHCFNWSWRAKCVKMKGTYQLWIWIYQTQWLIQGFPWA